MDLIAIGKVFHLMMIFGFLTCASSAFFLAPDQRKKLAPTIGYLGLGIMGTGAFLMTIYHTGMAGWVIAKMVVWVFIMGGAHSIAKRVERPGRVGVPFLIGLATLAAFFALFKPF